MQKGCFDSVYVVLRTTHQQYPSVLGGKEANLNVRLIVVRSSMSASLLGVIVLIYSNFSVGEYVLDVWHPVLWCHSTTLWRLYR